MLKNIVGFMESHNPLITIGTITIVSFGITMLLLILKITSIAVIPFVLAIAPLIIVCAFYASLAVYITITTFSSKLTKKKDTHLHSK